MNIAMNEIKNTLEGANSRIMEAENRISEVEGRLVEINEAERKKEKRIKRNEDNLRELWDNKMHQHLHYRGLRRREKRMNSRKYLKRLQPDTSLPWERKQSPMFRKCRESHAG